MKDVKKYCVAFLVIILLIPISQRFLKFHTTKPLHGLYPMANYPSFHFKDWMSGDYQKLADKFVNDNFGFRNVLLRTANSIDYILFQKANSPKILIGKENHLFFDYNIKSYLGITRQDTVITDSLFNLTDTVISKLKSRNIEFIFAIAPSNATYYSEYLPRQFKKYPKLKSDYDYYLEKFESHNINYIDFDAWFLQMKDTVSYSLFPETGTHYSMYSAVWVADSLIRYMENLKQIDIPDIIYDSCSIEMLRENERDLQNLLNLNHGLRNDSMLYYSLKFDSENKTKPKVLVVGDSFYWHIMNQLIALNCFSNVEFWFYNQKVYPESFTRELTPDMVNFSSLFNDLDFVIIFTSSTRIHNYDYTGLLGNINTFLSSENTSVNPNIPNDIAITMDNIYNNSEWYEAIKKKANDLNVSVESQVYIEAKWMVNMSKSKEKQTPN